MMRRSGSLAGLALLLTACAGPRVEYRPLPSALVPDKPVLPTVLASEFRPAADTDNLVISSGVYDRLAERDRLLRRYISELRALLGVEP